MHDQSWTLGEIIGGKDNNKILSFLMYVKVFNSIQNPMAEISYGLFRCSLNQVIGGNNQEEVAEKP